MNIETKLPEPTCELEQWALAEVAKRRRSGAPVAAAVMGIGAEAQAGRLVAAGAQTLLLTDTATPTDAPYVHRLPAEADDPAAALPLAPFDLILDQRTLSAVPYATARQAVRRHLARLKIGGKLFLSLYGLHSDLGEQYPDGGKFVSERFCPLDPEVAARYGLPGPHCLYSERNLFSLLVEAGGAVIRTSTSALGHVRGIAARV